MNMPFLAWFARPATKLAMEKFFNNAGPRQPQDIYWGDPLKRVKLHLTAGL